MKRLIFIGDDFYSKSGTIMSPLYEEGTWERWDWGFVQVTLGEGEEVRIRPATDAELGTALKMLRQIETKRKR